jgi:hypothetical protein
MREIRGVLDAEGYELHQLDGSQSLRSQLRRLCLGAKNAEN